MVTREKLFRWITIFIILAFVLELVLIGFQGGGGVQPTATPTPTPEPGFEGVGAGSARALRLGSDVLVECEGATREAVEAVRRVPGVTLALLSPGGQVVSARLNATLNESEFRAAVGLVEDALWPACDPRPFRSADLTLDGSVNVTHPATNASRSYSQRTLSLLFQQLGQRGVVGWITPQAELNESISVAVIVRLNPGEQPFAFVQEERPDFTPLSARSARLDARVEALQDEGIARVEVAWERRAVDVAALEAAANRSLGGAGARASLDARHTILYALEADEPGANQTRQALANLSFVENVNSRNDSVILFVGEDFTARAAALAEILARVPGAQAARVSFPASDLSLAFNFTPGVGFDGAVAALEALVPGPVDARRGAEASFVNASEARAVLGVGRVPARFPALMLGTANVSDIITLNVVASARGKRLTGLAGEQSLG